MSGRPTAVLVAFRTLGCKVNRVESDTIASELLGRGAEIADEGRADVVIINTCTVTAEANAKARKAVRQALKADSRPLVVVTGCLAALDAEGLRALGEHVVVESDKGRIAQTVSERLDLTQEGAPIVAVGGAFRTRALLKIEDGCDNFCTYCIVPYARGLPRSVPIADVESQAHVLADSGAREIVLTGINIGRYRDAGLDLADVIERVASSGIERIRISSIEPPDVTERLISTLRSTPAVCEHFHVPLQSGSDTVLGRMQRKYDTRKYARCIEAIREAFPTVAITTDLISGFPGETDAEHAQSMRFVQRIGFAKLHVFRYSAREGTPAAVMEQVDPAVRHARASELRLLGERLRADYVTRREGEVAEVLIESVERGRVTGTTRDYLRMTFEHEQARVGGLVETVVSSTSVVG